MDVGDLLRTAAATASEEERNVTKVAADPEAANAIVAAFAEVLGDRLNPREHHLLPFGGWIITMEQCIRYLTDYLEGDVYYGERYPGHNLHRAQNQLALARSMEETFVDISAVR
jgi:N-acetylhexosamine 1-kinase